MAGNVAAITAAGATNPSGLDGWGWIITSLLHTTTLTADFMSSADDTPLTVTANATGDKFISPYIFGNYTHQLLVGQKLGYLPTRLFVDFYGAFTTASTDEVATFMGFDNTSPVAIIYSDGTNFQLTDGTLEDAGPVIDTDFHQWRIRCDSATSLSTWWVDGVEQGSIAIKADRWPVAFACEASTTNRFELAWLHVYYE
jgi:hypothetical protein